jgi:hypothetical protein
MPLITSQGSAPAPPKKPLRISSRSCGEMASSRPMDESPMRSASAALVSAPLMRGNAAAASSFARAGSTVGSGAAGKPATRRVVSPLTSLFMALIRRCAASFPTASAAAADRPFRLSISLIAPAAARIASSCEPSSGAGGGGALRCLLMDTSAEAIAMSAIKAPACQSALRTRLTRAIQYVDLELGILRKGYSVFRPIAVASAAYRIGSESESDGRTAAQILWSSSHA